NQDYKEIVSTANDATNGSAAGATNAPYLNSLIAQYGLATDYNDSGNHPSLPNLLYLISGDSQYPGFLDVDPMQSFITGTFPVKADNLGGQMQTAGIAWRSYQEDMGTPCKLTGAGNYAPKHDPFL